MSQVVDESMPDVDVQTDQGAMTQPEIESHRLSQLVRSMIEFSRKHKEQHKRGESDYERRLMLYSGKFYDIWGRFYDWQAEPEANIVKPVVDAIYSNITDTRPVMKFVPKNAQSQAFADMARDASESVYEDADGILSISSSVLESCLHGMAVVKETFQPQMNDGQGAIVWDAMSLQSCFFDPKAKDNITFRGARWFIEVQVISIAELKEMFGDKVEGMMPGVPKEFVIDKPSNQYLSGVKVETPVEMNGESRMQIARIGQTDAAAQAEPDATTIFIQAWLKDVPAEWLGMEDGEDAPPTGEKPWKVFYFGGSDYRFLDWHENPYRHQQLPYTGIPTTQRPGLPYGEADPDVLEGNQQIMVSLLSKYIDILTMTSCPTLINSMDDGDDNIVTTAPGQVMRPNKAEGIRWLEYRGSSAEILGVIQTIRNLSQVTSGVMDVLLGNNPRGVSTAEGLRTLEERAMARLHPRIRLLGRAVRHLWLQQFSLMQQYYTQERFLAKAAASENDLPFIRLNQLLTPDQAQTMIRRGLPVGIRELDDGSTEYYLNDITQGEFDVHYTEGEGVPASRTEKANMALDMYGQQRPLLRRIDVLRALDWPHAAEVDAELTAQEQQQQQQAMQAQQMQAQMQMQSAQIAAQSKVASAQVSAGSKIEAAKISLRNKPIFNDSTETAA